MFHAIFQSLWEDDNQFMPVSVGPVEQDRIPQDAQVLPDPPRPIPTRSIHWQVAMNQNHRALRQPLKGPEHVEERVEIVAKVVGESHHPSERIEELFERLEAGRNDEDRTRRILTCLRD